MSSTGRKMSSLLNYHRLKKLMCSIFRHLNEHSQYSDPVMKVFGIFGLINFPFFYLYWKLYADVHYDDIILRCIATLLCLFLALKKFWPPFLKPLLPFYWYCTVTFCIPFYATYVFLQTPASNSWGLNIILGLFWLIIILDWISFTIVLCVGTISAFIIHGWRGGVFPNHLSWEVFINIFWVVLTSILFLRKKEDFAQEKAYTMEMLAGAIAHEMRTPLFSLSNKVQALKTNLPLLIKGYRKAQDANLETDGLDQQQLKILSDIPRNLQKTARETFSVIDMLLINLRGKVIQTNLKICSIDQCIEHTLNEYPLTKIDKELIVWEKGNVFSFRGDSLLLKHVLFNLIKNALYYVKAANKGKIIIRTERGEKFNSLYFTDTGKGIAQEDLPFIFDRFYSKTKHGTGIGLHYCKSVMNGFGGNIYCKSQEGEFSEFRLTFPII